MFYLTLTQPWSILYLHAIKNCFYWSLSVRQHPIMKYGNLIYKMQLIFCACFIKIVLNLIHSQTIRESWANTSEFNYSFFRKMHANYPKPLSDDIKFAAWRDYSIMPATSSSNSGSSADSTTNTLVNQPSLSDVNFPVKVVFLVGETPNNQTQLRLVHESDMFGDLIQESFLDTYNNLTLKTIMMLKWVTTNCGDRGKMLKRVFALCIC